MLIWECTVCYSQGREICVKPTELSALVIFERLKTIMIRRDDIEI